MATAPQTAVHPTPVPAPIPVPETAQVAQAEAAQTQGLRRRRPQGKRALPKPTPVYFVFQVLGDDGQPIPFSKSKIKILACERNTDKVLDIIDGDEHEHAVYIRGMLAPARVPGAGTATNGAAPVG